MNDDERSGVVSEIIKKAHSAHIHTITKTKQHTLYSLLLARPLLWARTLAPFEEDHHPRIEVRVRLL